MPLPQMWLQKETDREGKKKRIDDGECANETYHLVGRLFMDMLATLEREKILTKDSEVLNLGHIMTLFMAMPAEMNPYGILDDSKQESLGPAKDKKKWHPHSFDSQILAYARKYDIKLYGSKDLDDLISEVEGEGEGDLPKPESNSSAKADVFEFAKKFKSYKSRYATTHDHGPGRKGKATIGGDKLDITSWSSAQRKAHAFNHKDPLGKKEIDSIKQGLVFQVS